jgi:hypothetical protein
VILCISIAIIVSYSITINSFFPINNLLVIQKEKINTDSLFAGHLLLPYNSNFGSINSKTIDPKGDVRQIQIYKSNTIPEIKDYYDILSTNIDKVNGKLVFSMDLAGDPNKNERYETAYIWLLYYNKTYSRILPTDNSAKYNAEQIYTIIIPNFAADSKFKSKGWYMAIFNNTNNLYILPMTKISDMPNNKVQVFIDPKIIGNPSSLNYFASVMVRVNSTFLDKPPDFLMDSSPDNNKFWQTWFKK